ncbi:hypothetical protein SNE40_015468 [Patella caerulea]|uniref:C2H2-type domain-containing protein n=1 Tax=Patella caerulea TaxID=87958 RepID=A0AAN8JM92_PATCE
MTFIYHDNLANQLTGSSDTLNQSQEFLEWDISNIDTSALPRLENPIDLYLECDDDDCYLAPPSTYPTTGPSTLIGQNVHLKISFPPNTESSLDKNNLFSCQECEQRFKSEKKVKDHMKAFHKIEKPYNCLNCEYSSTSLKLLNRHKKRCKDRTAINKSDASSKAPPVSLRATSETPNKEQMHEVESEIDNSSHIISSSFINNLLQDKIEKPFKCSDCSFSTKSSSLLKSHIQTVHDYNRETFNCVICNFECKQKRTLMDHMLSHDDNCQVLVCDICKKTYISHEKLKRHLLTHSTERPFGCVLCSSTFKIQGRLTDHIKSVHCKPVNVTKTKSFVCSWQNCDKVFRDNYNLKLHLKTHAT